jgi:hypothetical protein
LDEAIPAGMAFLRVCRALFNILEVKVLFTS